MSGLPVRSNMIYLAFLSKKKRLFLHSLTKLMLYHRKVLKFLTNS